MYHKILIISKRTSLVYKAVKKNEETKRVDVFARNKGNLFDKIEKIYHKVY